jgi:hypothetical protein
MDKVAVNTQSSYLLADYPRFYLHWVPFQALSSILSRLKPSTICTNPRLVKKRREVSCSRKLMFPRHPNYH